MKNCLSRPHWMTPFLALPWVCAAGWAAAAQPAGDPMAKAQAEQVQIERDAERARIQKERKVIQDHLHAQEAACYKKFAVDACLRDARSEARAQDMTLRGQELKLNEAERREKAADRRAFIEQNEEQQREKIEAGRDKAEATDPAARAEAHAQERAQRASEAGQRAAQQKSREAAHAQSESKRQASEPGRVERARMRYEAKQRKAEERRVRHEKDMEDAAKSGKTPAASLPEPTSRQ
ncbi:MAG: hypothetical protein LBE61_18385 [Burkholderiaceae bacterium]|jgi:hypothetical protein|nr:hypothetical protein [Burkholderiaceae bacterium]